MAFKVLNVLSAKNISVDIILQSIGRGDKKDISFTVARTDLKDAVAVLEEARGNKFECEAIDYEEHVAKVSIVGAGMESNAGVAAKMFEALYNANINIRMIDQGSSELNIIVAVDEADYTPAIRSLYHAVERMM